MKTRKYSPVRRTKVNARATTPPRARRKTSIPYLEAMQIILDFETQVERPSKTEQELAAVVSHWLQSPELEPLLLESGTGERWRGILADYLDEPDIAEPASELAVSFSDLPFPPVAAPQFTFADLFAGIGGFRIALQAQSGKCVFSSEWDAKAKQTYEQNYGEVPFGDIRQFTGLTVSDRELARLVPDHDVMAGGFPCQPFSRAGVSARSSLGQSHGFSCEIQGTLFFDMMRIAMVKRPRVLFLENVKNLKVHDGGRTFDRIRSTIENDLGYSFHAEVIDASPLVPQRRKRCYIVCFRDKRAFAFPSIKGDALPLSMALESGVDERYTLSDRMWQGHEKRTQRNLDRGTGFTAHTADLAKPSNTLVARYYKDGKECLVPQPGRNPRLLTPRECANLQGYPSHFIPHPVNSHAYRQFGNSVAVPVVTQIAAAIASQLRSV